ncbi:MAG: DUF6048 family protein [Muribaculum sp.]|nr:DUF6048 family protein [Muribaculum sp.]
MMRIKSNRLLLIIAMVPILVVMSASATSSATPQTEMRKPEITSADSVAADTLRAETIGKGSRRGSITPVDIDRAKPAGPTLHYYDRHGNPLEEPIMFLTDLDTVKAPAARSPYPAYCGVNIGLNFADAVLMAAGQKHGSFDLWANVSIRNWFFPTIEVGVGMGSDHPEDGNFHYKAKAAPYVKLGMDYNFLYKSKPDYQAFVGLRAGFSTYKYDITDISVTNGYWQQTQHYDILNQSASSFYGEAVGGLKVKIYRNFSMGWTLRYHFKIHTWQKVKAGEMNPGGNPWFIPGYGTSSPLRVTFSLIWSLPSGKCNEAVKKITQKLAAER